MDATPSSELSDSQSSASQSLFVTKKKRKRNKKNKLRSSKSCTSDNTSSPNSSPPSSPRSTLSSLPSLSLSLPSLPSLPSLLPSAPRSPPPERNTITVFENGKRFNGKAIFLPASMDELLMVATEKLRLPSQAQYVLFFLLKKHTHNLNPVHHAIITTHLKAIKITNNIKKGMHSWRMGTE